MADYTTTTAFRAAIHDTSSEDTTVIAQCLTSASRAVDQDAGWPSSSFVAIGTAIPRYFTPSDSYCCEFSDGHASWGASSTALTLKTDSDGDGTYETTWTYGSQFILEPRNQARGGVSGWPYDEVKAVGSLVFPKPTQRQPYPVEVSALWGWAAIPDPIVTATQLMANAMYKRPDAPFGVAGFDGFGAVRVRADPMYWQMLRPFMRASRMVA